MQLTAVGFNKAADFISEFHNADAVVVKTIDFPIAFPNTESVMLTSQPEGYAVVNGGDTVRFAVGETYTYTFELEQAPDVGPNPTYVLQVCNIIDTMHEQLANLSCLYAVLDPARVSDCHPRY